MRSQMAKGWTRYLKNDLIEVYSAGTETHGLNPNTVKITAEAGVDISAHQSQHIDAFRDIKLDYVIIVCGNAHETCPMSPGKSKVIHVGFDDPPKMAETCKNEEDKLNCFRTVRDQIKVFVETLPEKLTGK